MANASQPRDSRLRSVQDALVRVFDSTSGETGTGFLLRTRNRLVVTAAHVLSSDAAKATIKTASGRCYSLDVILRNAQTDVALLADRPEMQETFLGLYDDDVILVGDEVWLAGFPVGWDEEPTPVFSCGIVAGIGRETWLNIDANWGQSGGPVFVLTDAGPKVVGIVRGPGGRASKDLDGAIQGLKLLHADLEILARTGGQGWVGGLDMKRFALTTATSLKEISALVRDHFRSGNVRIVSLQDLSSQLPSQGVE